MLDSVMFILEDMENRLMFKLIKPVINEPIIEPIIEEVITGIKPISEQEINQSKSITRWEYSMIPNIENDDEMNTWLPKVIKLTRELKIDLKGEGVELNYDSIETVDEFFQNVKNIVLDDDYMTGNYGHKWE